MRQSGGLRRIRTMQAHWRHCQSSITGRGMGCCLKRRGSSAVGLQKIGTRRGGSLWIRMVGGTFCLNPEQSSFDPLASFSSAGNRAQAKGLSLLMGRTAKARLLWLFLRLHAQKFSQKIIFSLFAEGFSYFALMFGNQTYRQRASYPRLHHARVLHEVCRRKRAVGVLNSCQPMRQPQQRRARRTSG